MIGKVVRGSNVGKLLQYLYGPGRANEHADPHLVAGFQDPQELRAREPGVDESRDLRRLTGVASSTVWRHDRSERPQKPVWHCSVRAAPGDRLLSDAEWGPGRRRRHGPDRASHAHHDDLGARWIAVRHTAGHLHIVATLARQDGGRVPTWNDFFRVRDACRDAERRLGLRCHGTRGSHRCQAAPPVPRQSSRSGAAGDKAAPHHASPGGYAPRRPEQVRSGSSSPGWSRLGCS